VMGKMHRYVALNYEYLHEINIIASEALVYQDNSDIENGSESYLTPFRSQTRDFGGTVDRLNAKTWKKKYYLEIQSNSVITS